MKFKSKPITWFNRWNIACDKLWKKFNSKPVSKDNFYWMERNHERLMKLSESKFKL